MTSHLEAVTFSLALFCQRLVLKNERRNCSFLSFPLHNPFCSFCSWKRDQDLSLSLSLRSPFILHGSSCTEITGRRNEWRNYAATFGCVRCKKRGETWQRLDPLERRRRDANTLPFFCLLLRIFLSLSLSLWRPA